MVLKLYNSLTRTKETFISLVPGKVKMYVCGPTVYSYIHIGNARAFVVFDVLRRYLKFLKFKVEYVQNLTDVDDKLLSAARLEGVALSDLARKYIAAYAEDMSALGVYQADQQPKATEYIENMCALIERLIAKDYAYLVENDVYFRVRKKKDYGKLVQQSLDDLRVGSRVENNPKKEHPLDFVLWKGRGADDEVSWPSPWGEGRPGWHTECVAMILQVLGDQIDIHAGGVDLCFPHHENELAQGEALTKKTLAKYWLHNGFVQMSGEKMSKSVGNICTVRSLLEQYTSLALRYYLLSVHYRSPMDFSSQIMEQAENSVRRLQGIMDRLVDRKKNAVQADSSEDIKEQLQAFALQFKAAMNDDLNTANAIGVLFAAVKYANEVISSNQVSSGSLEAIHQFLTVYGIEILGLIAPGGVQVLDEEIKTLVAEREQARSVRNYARADEIRAKLTKLGIILEDTGHGVRWRRSKDQ
ncbi:MAG: hypothetical protein RLZ12_903 [Bacillota bacterium]|jgi:cysteinyl-tRNA synthetase